VKRYNLDANMRNTTSEVNRKHKILPVASKMIGFRLNNAFQNTSTLINCEVHRHLFIGCCIAGSLESHTLRFLMRIKHMRMVLLAGIWNIRMVFDRHRGGGGGRTVLCSWWQRFW
jgi:hypothetical protein